MNEITKKCILFLGVVLLFFPTFIEGIAHPAYKPGEILVKLKKGISFHQLQNNIELRNLEVKTRFSTLSSLKGQDYLLLKINEQGENTESAAAELLSNVPGIEAVSLNYRRKLCRVPNDPLFDRQWGLYNTGQIALINRGTAGADINAPSAWDINTGSPDVVIAVIDTGVDYLHEDLKNNIWQNPGEIPGNGFDDDGNYFVDDVYGYDFAGDLAGNNDPDPMGFDSHGTNIAGIIAAKGNNGIGVTGVCWDAKIMIAKAFRPTVPDPYIYSSDEIEAFEYIVMMKTQYDVNVVAINCSYGGTGFSQVEKDAVEEAGSAGIIVCAAAGNGGDDEIGDDNDETPMYPASYDVPNIISVAASDGNDELADFSNYGAQSVDIAAPGVEIKSTALTGQGEGSAYVEANGTVFHAIDMEYSGYTNGITRPAYYCGQGLSAGDFPTAVNGNIALIERGTITFAQKVTNAQDAGALAAIIYNNVDGDFLGTLGENRDWIPTLSMSNENGLLLRNMTNPVITLENKPSNYAFGYGTSTSTPFASGAVGILASRFPQENLNMRIIRLLLASEPLPSLQNRIRSGGRLNIGSLKLQAPLNLHAQRFENRSLLQTEYINFLTWQANPQNQSYNITGYRVFRVSGNELSVITDVDANQLEYLHRNAGQESQYTYAVVAVDANGSTGEPAVISL